MLLGNLETHAFERTSDECERYTVTVSPAGAVGQIDDALLTAFLPHAGDSLREIRPGAEEARELAALFSMLVSEFGRADFPGAADMLLSAILLRLYRIRPGIPAGERRNGDIL